MSVYVDPLRPCRTSATWPYTRSCHLVADTLEELHAFAKKIGLKRAWYQGDHYDLSPARQTKAFKAGAALLDPRDFVLKVRALRAQISKAAVAE